MPPCAAMLCARRGESWKQKHLTLYPSSPSVAAADAPARPLPMTIMSNLGRLFGATSFDSPRCFSHFFSSGPEGTLESRVAGITLPDNTEKNGHGNRNVTGESQPGKCLPADRYNPGYPS